MNINHIPFIKMHGLGNDFVIVSNIHIPKELTHNEFAKIIGNRRLGVGCDQIVIYDDIDSNNEVRTYIYNKDGSNVKACGNASRCLTRIIFDKTNISDFILKIDDRIVKCQFNNQDNISVDMGRVSFNPEWLPPSGILWNLCSRYAIQPKETLCVDVANKHIVIFSKLSNRDQKIIGRDLQEDIAFPDGINVNFAYIENSKIHLKVYERGVGFTHACGSGAVATFASANRLGFVGNLSEILFEHGSLLLEKKQDTIIMSGSAEYTFKGEFLYERE